MNNDLLLDECVKFINNRFGENSDEGAAVVLTDSGKILISTAPETLNDSVSLCHETGAYCEAYKINEKIKVSLCVHISKKGRVVILSPCGVCQERLRLYGSSVKVAVPSVESISVPMYLELDEIQPHHWSKVLKDL